jgi:hypothetical protein
MTNGSRHAGFAWLEHVPPAVFVLTFAVMLWQPRSPAVAIYAPGEERVTDLAGLLGERAPRLDEIERLLSIGRFPPAKTAGRQLGDALVACTMADVGEPQRTALARQLYAITAGGDVSAERLALTLIDIQQTAIRARCSPERVTALVDAARVAARTEPSPRRDWW